MVLVVVQKQQFLTIPEAFGIRANTIVRMPACRPGAERRDEIKRKEKFENLEFGV